MSGVVQRKIQYQKKILSYKIDLCKEKNLKDWLVKLKNNQIKKLIF